MEISKTLKERGDIHGDFTYHARMAQALKGVMYGNCGFSNWAHLNDVQRQALEVIVDKIARILVGNPDFHDHWHDIQGYAKLVEDRLSA